MKSQSAIFVDAGFLLAVGCTQIAGTLLRSAFTVDYKKLVQGVLDLTVKHSGLEALRVYWYDASKGALFTSSFAPGELAHLALTLKVELPPRDRLAWSLSTKLPDFVVAHEWKRTDLAILDPSATPVALIEAKALYTFDVANTERTNVREYTGMVESDLAKARRLLAGRPASVLPSFLWRTPSMHLRPASTR